MLFTFFVRPLLSWISSQHELAAVEADGAAGSGRNSQPRSAGRRERREKSFERGQGALLWTILRGGALPAVAAVGDDEVPTRLTSLKQQVAALRSMVEAERRVGRSRHEDVLSSFAAAIGAIADTVSGAVSSRDASVRNVADQLAGLHDDMDNIQGGIGAALERITSGFRELDQRPISSAGGSRDTGAQHVAEQLANLHEDMDNLQGSIGSALDQMASGFRELHQHLDEIVASAVDDSSERSDRASSSPSDPGPAGPVVDDGETAEVDGQPLADETDDSGSDTLSEDTRALLDDGYVLGSRGIAPRRRGGRRDGRRQDGRSR